MAKLTRMFLVAAVLTMLLPKIVEAQYWATTFYVGAHQDDWILFMDPNAYNDVQQAGVKVVFVYVTAGDAGCGDGPTTPSSYYRARELAAANAVHFMASVNAAIPDSDQGTWSTKSVSGHNINIYTYNNTVSYYLRLPDGDGDLCGTVDHTASLSGLQSGTVASLTAVDSSSIYNGWGDLVETLYQIVNAEKGSSWDVFLNYPNPDTTINDGDHPDHIMTGIAMQTAAGEVPCASQALFLDYVINTMPPNLSTADIINKAGVFGTGIVGRVNSDWPGGWDSAHLSWIPEQYFSVVWGSGC